MASVCVQTASSISIHHNTFIVHVGSDYYQHSEVGRDNYQDNPKLEVYENKVPYITTLTTFPPPNNYYKHKYSLIGVYLTALKKLVPPTMNV